jgi:hypothetical protein
MRALLNTEHLEPHKTNFPKPVRYGLVALSSIGMLFFAANYAPDVMRFHTQWKLQQEEVKKNQSFPVPHFVPSYNPPIPEQGLKGNTDFSRRDTSILL